MGFISKVLKLSTFSAASGTGAWLFLTKDSHFQPLTSADPIFSSVDYNKNNPDKHTGTQDFCVKKVPLSKIKPELLENGGKRLTEAFCAGVWSGLGYAYQRSYLEKKYRGPTTAHQLWNPADLKNSSYEVGTEITDHFIVTEKTSDHITVRCGDSPLKTGLRASDGLFEMSAKINKEEGVVEFGLKSVFYNGLDRAGSARMPSHVEFAHRLYTKLWMETAMRNTTL